MRETTIKIFAIIGLLLIPQNLCLGAKVVKQVRNLGLGEAACRAIGMGHAFVAVSDDSSGAFWNPAGLALIPPGRREAQVMVKGNLRNELTYDSISISGQTFEDEQQIRFTISEYLEHRLQPPVSKQKVAYAYGLGAIFSTMEDGYKMNSVALGFGKRFHSLMNRPGSHIAGGLKFRSNSYENYVQANGRIISDSDQSLGAGMIYEFSEFLNIGLSVDNLLKSSDLGMPTIISLGLALHIDPTTLIAMDGYNLVDIVDNGSGNKEKAEFRVGMEKRFIDNDLTFRLGSKNGNLNMGFGMQITEAFRVDYAFMGDYDDDIQQHFIAGVLTF